MLTGGEVHQEDSRMGALSATHSTGVSSVLLESC